MNVDDIKILLSEEVQNFICDHENDDIDKMLFKYHKEDLPIHLIAEQIKCRIKARKKFPTLSKKPFIYESTAFEQSSSEATANYKTNILSGNSIIDLTGGLGIDLLTIGNNFDKITYCDINESLVELFKYNSGFAGRKDYKVIHGDSIEHLKSTNEVYDWIYLDPARRSENRRSVDLEYCAPNVYENLDLLKSKAKNICIKVSPAFDYAEAAKRIPGLTNYVVVSVNNECKEVLLLIKPGTSNGSAVKQAVCLDEYGNVRFEIDNQGNEKTARSIYEAGPKYFYEPDVSIIKAGISEVLTLKHQVMFINHISDYMVSDVLVPEFPGRQFEIISIFPYKVDVIKKVLKEKGIKKANVAKRHFPINVDEIRKKLKLGEGGGDYLFFTKDSSDHQICYFTKKVEGTLSNV